MKKENSDTNTSLNVTVGSEVSNNSSFSFFGRGRKRDRTPPLSQSAQDIQIECPLSPPKRARKEGFLSVVASPLTMLRNRFSKASLRTPQKQKAETESAHEVQNLTGVSIEEELPNGGEEPVSVSMADITVGSEVVEETGNKDLAEGSVGTAKENAKVVAPLTIEINDADNDNNDDILFKETPIIAALGEPGTKNKRCSIM